MELAARQRGETSPARASGIWRSSQVKAMLRNPAYAGEWQWGKTSKKLRPEEYLAAACPPIVSVETLAIAARILASNRRPEGRSPKRQYLLRGLITCADCGLVYCGSAARVVGGERMYYRCNGAHQWHKFGRKKCESMGLRADQLEAVVWEDVKAFVRAPAVARSPLRAQRAPVDATLGERLAEVESQLEELARRERNALRLATEAPLLSSNALNDVLREIRTGEASMKAYRASLKACPEAGEALDQELFSIPKRLANLGEWIDEASFEERQRAVRRLVKSIMVGTQVVDGRRTPLVSITYHFQDLGLQDVSPFRLFSGGPDTIQSSNVDTSGGLELTRTWQPGGH